MRKEELNLPVIEWSASQVTAYDPAARRYISGANLAEIATQLSGAKKVVVALSRRSSFVRTVRVPDAPKEQVAQVLKIQLPSILPIPAGDVAFDFKLTKSFSEEGRLAVVGAVSAESLRLVQKELKEAGLNAVQIVPVAFGSALLAQSLSEETCAIAEQSSEGLAIDIIAEGELRYTRTVPLPKDPDGIAEEVCRTFNVARVSCSRIVAAGGLKFPAADSAVVTRSLETFSTGLRTKLDVNIELPEAVEQRRKKSEGARGRAVLFLWLAVIVAGTADYLNRTDAAENIAKDNALYYSDKQKYDGKLNAGKAQLAAETDLQSALAAAFNPAQLPTDAITEIMDKMPADKMWSTGFTFERGKPMMLRGTALDSDSVAAYVQALAVDSRFRDVKLVFANNGEIENHPIVEFSLQVHVMGNLPLTDPFKTAAVH